MSCLLVRGLEAGQCVITGSFTKPLPIKQGERRETHFSSVKEKAG